MNNRAYTILMLEHDEDDRFITSSIISGLKYKIDIDFVSDPKLLFAYLKEINPSPHLIILDLVLPSGNGLDTLKALKNNETYKHIPTLVVSGSLYENIIIDCYKAGANSFFSKPFTDKTTVEKISLVMDYWFGMAELPVSSHIPSVLYT